MAVNILERCAWSGRTSITHRLARKVAYRPCQDLCASICEDPATGLLALAGQSYPSKRANALVLMARTDGVYGPANLLVGAEAFLLRRRASGRVAAPRLLAAAAAHLCHPNAVTACW